MYAFKDGKLVNIDSVNNGIQCGCVCPKCGEKLVARNGGTRMQHHFAHSADSTCVGSAETALHLIAKEVVKESGMLMLPDYDDYKGTPMAFDEIILEERQEDSGLRPDCIGVKNGHQLWIEIKVNHAVDGVKLQYIRDQKQGCVELDLTSFLDKPYTRDDLQQFLSNDKSQKEWLYIARHYEKHEAARQEALAQEQQNIERRLILHPEEHLCQQKRCALCPHHSTRQSITQLLHNYIPRYRDMIEEITSLPFYKLQRPLAYKCEPPKGMVICGNYSIPLYNIYKECWGRQLYDFFSSYLPCFVTRLGRVCNHQVLQTSDGRIICNCQYTK